MITNYLWWESIVWKDLLTCVDLKAASIWGGSLNISAPKGGEKKSEKIQRWWTRLVHVFTIYNSPLSMSVSFCQVWWICSLIKCNFSVVCFFIVLRERKPGGLQFYSLSRPHREIWQLFFVLLCLKRNDQKKSIISRFTVIKKKESFFQDGDARAHYFKLVLHHGGPDTTVFWPDGAAEWSCLIHVFPTSTRVAAYLKNQNVSRISSK